MKTDGIAFALQEDTTLPQIIAEANDALGRDDIRAAERLLSRATQLNPRDAELICALGNLRLQLEECAGAVAAYRAAAALQPLSEHPHANSALALLMLGRSAEAKAAALAARELNGRNPVALKVLARLFVDEGDAAQARLCCESLLAANPADADALALLQGCEQAPRTRAVSPESSARHTGAISPGVLVLGSEANAALRRSRPGKPASLQELARAVGDDWKNHPYYDQVEAGIAHQWDHHVWPFIREADFACVLDLAAGHGRNSERLRQFAQKLYVVDINQENIDYCRRRFAGDDRFTFIRNDGTSLQPIPDGSISLAYCFDAMVHFDSDVVRSYLREFHRVLQRGGLGFCHHSNYVGNPGGDVHDNKGWRNYMSQSLFAHYCAKEGLRVLKAKLIDWEAPGSDCVTLFLKP